MSDKQLYLLAINYLSKLEGIEKEDIDLHLTPEYNKPDDIKLVYKRLCESGQNHQMYSNVIGKAIGGIENLGKVLFDFDPHKVSDNYLGADYDLLLTKIKSELNPRGKFRTTEASAWPKFSRMVVDSAHYLSFFDTAKDFYEWVDIYVDEPSSRLALPLLMSVKIRGLGFTLACDFLKEIGYDMYSKPDGQLKILFRSLGLVSLNEKDKLRQEFEVINVIERIARENHVTPYAVDKVFWLIGTGDFYRIKKDIGSQKNKFIRFIQDYN